MAAPVNVVFCKKNLELYSQSVYDALSTEFGNHPDVEISVSDCPDHCGICTDIPFALRNNAVVGGRDPRDLYKKLAKGMEFLSRPYLPGTARYRSVSLEDAPKETGTPAGNGHSV